MTWSYVSIITDWHSNCHLAQYHGDASNSDTSPLRRNVKLRIISNFIKMLRRFWSRVNTDPSIHCLDFVREGKGGIKKIMGEEWGRSLFHQFHFGEFEIYFTDLRILLVQNLYKPFPMRYGYGNLFIAHTFRVAQ